MDTEVNEALIAVYVKLDDLVTCDEKITSVMEKKNTVIERLVHKTDLQQRLIVELRNEISTLQIRTRGNV